MSDLRALTIYDQSYPPSLWTEQALPLTLDVTPRPGLLVVDALLQNNSAASVFDWGDGTTDDLGPWEPPGGFTGQPNHEYVSAGTYTVRCTMGAESVSDPVTVPGAAERFNPSEHTIPDVLAYVDDHPDELAEVRDAEYAGKARVTLLDALDALVAGTGDGGG